MKEQELINDLVSGELPPERVPEVQAMLESNPSLRDELQSMQTVRGLLAKQCQPMPNPELWSQCRSRLDAIDGTRRVEGFVGRWQYGLAAGLLCVLLGVGLIQRNGLAGRGVSAGDIPALMSSAPAFGSGRSATVAPPDQLNLRRANLQLLAAFEGRHQGRSFRLYDVQDQLGVMRLVEMPGHSKIEGMTRSFDGRYLTGTVTNMPCVAWTEDDRVFMLMGGRDPLQLESAADLLRQR